MKQNITVQRSPRRRVASPRGPRPLGSGSYRVPRPPRAVTAARVLRIVTSAPPTVHQFVLPARHFRFSAGHARIRVNAGISQSSTPLSCKCPQAADSK